MDFFKNPWIPFIFNQKIIKLPIGRGVTNYLYYHSDWMTSLLKTLTSLQDGYFLDIGANLGQTLLTFHTVSQGQNLKYVAFEPDSYCVVYLKRLVELNKFHNASVVPIGISDQNRILELYSSSITDSGATFRQELRPSRQLFSSIVPTFKLDDIYKDLNLNPVSLIKIDVEGWELEVLKGMKELLQILRPIIICEVIFRDQRASLAEYSRRNQDLVDILKELKYNIHQIIKTENLKEIQKISKIGEFSNEVWNTNNKDLCDYLFIPAEKSEIVEKIGF